VTEHSQGSTTVMAIANLAMATGNIGKPGAGVNPLRGQNNVQGACDMGSFPHELAGYRHISDPEVRTLFENLWGGTIDSEPGLRINNMLDAATDGVFKAIYIQGEDILQSDPNTHHVAAGLEAISLVEEGDMLRAQLFGNAKYWRAGLEKLGFDLLPGEHPIIPVMLGEAQLAQDMASRLFDEGVYVSGFFFPVVPRGQARIRTQMNAALTKDELDRALDAFRKVGKELGVI
jgi:hypothetical protein